MRRVGTCVRCPSRTMQGAVVNLQQWQQEPSLTQKYSRTVLDYMDRGHAVPDLKNESKFVTHSTTGDKCFYLPHLAVIKETSMTTKTRTVFHASAKTTNKTSLKYHLLVGPTIQPDLVDKVFDFRKQKLVFVCDVEKMYRQIRSNKKDWDFQRFLWWECKSLPIQDYVSTTVTFGVASAPYMAIRTLLQILKKFCYVNDVHHGVEKIEELRKARDELIFVLRSAGLELRKWSANQPNILADLHKEHR